MDDETRAIMMARDYREQAKAYRQKAAALAAGDLAVPASDAPRIRRRPKVTPEQPTPQE
jgi:hypothetical protein